MSELLENIKQRRSLLKHMILQLHQGVAPEAVKKQLVRVLGEVPYGDVVVVEQELISEGLPPAEVLKLCDIHSAALKGHISQEGAKIPPPGHPVYNFKQENRALESVIKSLAKSFQQLEELDEDVDAWQTFQTIQRNFQSLKEVDRHYKRKEYLLFPYLEKRGITGPPTVMWGKHDEARGLLNSALEAFQEVDEVSAGEARATVDFLFKPAANAVEEMIFKEEQILFPMCLDTLSEMEWYQIYQQSPEYGFCLYQPTDEWQPEGRVQAETIIEEPEKIKLASGDFTLEELTALLNTVPFDITFVDRNDTVRYFSQGRERIFDRSRAILGRKVQMCHPPSSIHIVQKILDDFRNGRQDRATFWLNRNGRFISIEYFALRDEKGQYLGVAEVTQDLTEKRKLEGEQRLLNTRIN